MVNYEKLEDVIENKNVKKILRGMKLRGEGGLFLESVETSEELFMYNVYVESSAGDDGFVYCAKLSCKMIGNIKNWYIS